MTIGEALKRFRKEFKLTQDKVAEVLGTSKQSYYRYEKDVVPSAEIIKKISLAFNVSSDYLLGISDIPNNNPNNEMIDAVKNFYENFQQIVTRNTARGKSEVSTNDAASMLGAAPPNPRMIVE